MDETGDTHRPNDRIRTAAAEGTEEFFEFMTVKEVSTWLEGKNIPRKYCEVFEENFIDGKEFAVLTEADVKAMVPPIGLAKKIIRLVPKDSWVGKMIERIRNVIKRGKKKATTEEYEKSRPKKRRKLCSGKAEILCRYPVKAEDHSLDDIDSETLDQHKKAIEAEMKKAKPRDSVLLPLMKLTFSHRRMYLQNNAVSVKEILDKYSVLARPAVIEQEMALMLDKPDVKASFIKEWKDVYVPAILLYGRKSGKKGVKSKLIGLDETDETMRQVAALAILTESMCKPSKCAKDWEKEDHFCYLYETHTPTERIEDVCKGPRNLPRIVAFEGEERSQYFIICEQRVMCELPTFQSALFIMFAAYYILNLEYPKQVRSVFYFLQDYVIGCPDSLKRPITYIAVASDIRRNIVH